MKKQNIHKYILKESVVSNIMPSSLFGYKSAEKKKIHPVFANECERKKRKTYFCTPHMSRPAAFNKKKQTTSPISWISLDSFFKLSVKMDLGTPADPKSDFFRYPLHAPLKSATPKGENPQSPYWHII